MYQFRDRFPQPTYAEQSEKELAIAEVEKEIQGFAKIAFTLSEKATKRLNEYNLTNEETRNIDAIMAGLVSAADEAGVL